MKYPHTPILPWSPNHLHDADDEFHQNVDCFKGKHVIYTEKLDGELLYDIMLNNTDSKLVAQQLDIGNMINGGGVPAEVMKKFPGRFVSKHVKDEVPSAAGHEKFESTILGKGSGQIDVQALVKLGDKEGGTKHFIIEQESYQGLQPLACMKENIAIMRGWGYK
jgi:sugar phosphate isomerase/epimerase